MLQPIQEYGEVLDVALRQLRQHGSGDRHRLWIADGEITQRREWVPWAGLVASQRDHLVRRDRQLVDEQLDQGRQPRRPAGEQHQVAIEMVDDLRKIIKDIAEYRSDCVPHILQRNIHLSVQEGEAPCTLLAGRVIDITDRATGRRIIHPAARSHDHVAERQAPCLFFCRPNRHFQRLGG